MKSKTIHCLDCETVERVGKDKPDSCPFCESENIEINQW